MLFERPKVEITWTKPEKLRDKPDLIRSVPGQKLKPDLFEIRDSLSPLSNGLLMALDQEGFPSIEGLTPEQELIEFLKIAIEVEHGLMIQYLYAAYSCTNGGIMSTVATIATEEMGHMITVLNVLSAMDQKPHLGRYDGTQFNAFDPFPFSLQPINKKVIGKYALCERPDENEVDPEDKEVLKDIMENIKDLVEASKIARVGLLYMKIYWLLRENDSPLANPTQEPWINYPVELIAEIMRQQQKPEHHVSTIPINQQIVQARRLDWNNNLSNVRVEEVETSLASGRTSALKAIAVISAQGEGFAGENDGHFDRFVDAYKNTDHKTSISRNIVSDPWYAGRTPGGSTSEITSDIAIKLSTLGDYIYEILLCWIALGFHPDYKADDPKRSEIANYCIKSIMVKVYKPFVEGIGQIKIHTSADSPLLSLCFTLPTTRIIELVEIQENIRAKEILAVTLSEQLRQDTTLSFVVRNALKNVSSVLQSSPSFQIHFTA